MDLDRFVRLLAALFGLLGSALVAYSIMQISPKDLAPRTESFWGYNPYLLDVIAHEKADKITGFKLVAISFVFSAVAIFVSRSVRPRWWWFVLVVTLSGALFAAVWSHGQRIYQDTKLAMEKIIRSGNY